MSRDKNALQDTQFTLESPFCSSSDKRPSRPLCSNLCQRQVLPINRSMASSSDLASSTAGNYVKAEPMKNFAILIVLKTDDQQVRELRCLECERQPRDPEV